MGWREKQLAKLENTKVLMVGAGGIGCELLKDIVLCGFRNVHVIDLDTIDVSNLNRQFLFRREHVGRSKADVATAAARTFAPQANITFDHDSIYSEKFDYDFFRQFDLVLNALDNRAAREHVNGMCIANEIPLVDGGSAGYFAQVQPIIRGQTECYQCVQKTDNVKSFPGCTIRNTPSEHIHCTVWAKHVFNQLFGELEMDDEVSPDINSALEEGEKEGGTKNGEENMDTSESNGKASVAEESNGKTEEKKEEQPTVVNTRKMAEECEYDPVLIFNKLFVEDIGYLLKLDALWKTRRPPVPTAFKDLPTENAGSSNQATVKNALQQVWSPAECGDVFVDVVKKLKERKATVEDGILTWDKDDDDAMRFVAACANIRAHIFHIPLKSLFEIKSMAGNIIPAIATTNAIVSGAMLTEALKIINGQTSTVKCVVLQNQPSVRGKILNDTVPTKPSASCYMCSPQREVTVRVNIEKMTCGTLDQKVLKEKLSILEADVMIGATNTVLISSDEYETADIMPKTLAEMKVHSGIRLSVEDFDTGEKLRLCLLGGSNLAEDEFELVSDKPAKAYAEVAAEADKESVVAGRKRKSEAPVEGEPKRAKVEEDEEPQIKKTVVA